MSHESHFRPPAVPLITHDPYFSAWSFADRLTDDQVRHWTGSELGMCGLLRVDGQTFRFLGPDPSTRPALPQTKQTLWPTRTEYLFEGAGVQLSLSFCSPFLPSDLDVLARPVSYLTWSLTSSDGEAHTVALYLDVSARWTVDKPEQQVQWGHTMLGKAQVLRCGSHEQPILAKAGDNLRIDWGYLYLVVPEPAHHFTRQTALVDAQIARAAFVAGEDLRDTEDMAMPRAAADRSPALACQYAGEVGATQSIEQMVMLAYDDLYGIEYLQQRLRPYWRRAGQEIEELLQQALDEYPLLRERCVDFDTELVADLTRVGGGEFAQIAVLSYRQCLAAHKLVAYTDGTPFFFSKENFSNGCIATVDVTYPSSPFFLLFNPTLLRAQLQPVLDYAQSGRWPFPFAPHDLGTYPLANGQVYGGGERDERDQMPVEECGNMLILMAALAHIEGHAQFAQRYWTLLTQWASYLREKGLDPERQLCTDDFAGYLAHNTNLSLKAVLGLGSYARLAALLNYTEEAYEYRQVAEQFAAQWGQMARDDDHYRLAFDAPGSWSQKYNLVWDQVLHLDLFPREVAATEVAFYLMKLQPFGLPLDNRTTYTTLDHTVWSATLAESGADFHTVIATLYRYVTETPSRVPLCDWYWTHDGKQAGFQARSVVGGNYMPMLKDPTIWRKWATRSQH